MWVAKAESQHFSFEAYGNSKADALRVLAQGFKTHAIQYHIRDKNWWHENTDIRTVEIMPGVAYRDGEPI